MDKCPHCEVSLQGEEIPIESLRAGYYGDWREGDPPRYFSRKIGMEVQGVYDGTLFYCCPDCGGRWHRFVQGTHLHKLAIPYVNGPEWLFSQIPFTDMDAVKAMTGFSEETI